MKLLLLSLFTLQLHAAMSTSICTKLLEKAIKSLNITNSTKRADIMTAHSSKGTLAYNLFISYIEYGGDYNVDKIHKAYKKIKDK